jgi:UDP-N-acetylglucosamine 2-epimerase (non-hydrolysing)
MKVLSVVGARPQFVKLKPIVDALALIDSEHTIVHTGQHYDANMSDVFFSELGLPKPDVNLAVGSGSHSKQTGEILTKVEPVIAKTKPDWVLVYGDTNSTLAAALASVKIGVPLAHIEAGLRSNNRKMPEEINRVLTDHSSDMLFAPTKLAIENLNAEGLAEKSFLVGDVMADLILKVSKNNDQPASGDISTKNTGGYVVATIHRPSNTDDSERLRDIVTALTKLDFPVILVAHPRLKAEARKHGIGLKTNSLKSIEPLPYLAMLDLLLASSGLITDSGGLQKEAFLLGLPCTTIRNETEWPETLEGTMNVLNPDLVDLGELLTRNPRRVNSAPFGNGDAASKIVEILLDQRTEVPD